PYARTSPPISSLFPYTTLFRSILVTGGNAETEQGAQEKVDAVEIGGRNLIRNSDFSNGGEHWNVTPTFGNDGEYDYAINKSWGLDRKSTRLNSSHVSISYAVFC